MLYIPTIGVVNVQIAMMGEKRKLTLEVPFFCKRKRASNTTAERASTATTAFKKFIFKKDEEGENFEQIICEFLTFAY